MTSQSAPHVHLMPTVLTAWVLLRSDMPRPIWLRDLSPSGPALETDGPAPRGNYSNAADLSSPKIAWCWARRPVKSIVSVVSEPFEL
jgi:hypothetical protein